MREMQRVDFAEAGAQPLFVFDLKCPGFAATMAARDALPATAPAMARVELDLRLLELAQDFVKRNTKA